MSRSVTTPKPTGFGAIWFNIVESAAKYGHLDAAKLLIENGADVSQTFTQFHWNTDDGYYKILDLEEKRNFPYVESALGIAAGMGHVAIVQLLLKNRADPNIKTYLGRALARATAQGSEAVMKLLTEDGTLVI